MKLLLVEPPLALHKTGIFPRNPPHYALFAATVARQAGAQVAILDAFVENLTAGQTLARMAREAPDVVVFVQFDYVRETPPQVYQWLARGMARLRPEAALGLAGAVDPDYLRGQLRQTPQLQFAFVGEYELALRELVSRGAAALEGIGGLLVRRGDELLDTGPAEVVQDLDTLPFPDWEMVDLSRYTVVPHRFKQTPMYPLLASRGCPFGCRCCSEAMYAKISRFRIRSVADVMEEVRWAVRRYGAREIQFGEPVFGLKKQWAHELCEAMESQSPRLSWSAVTRVDLVDGELLRQMSRAGCWNVLYGVESANQRSLELVNKRLDPARVHAAVQGTREAGMEVTASFIIGLPGEDRHSVLRTIDLALELDPDYVQFFIFKYFGVDGALDRYGTVDPRWDLAPFDFRGPIFVPHAFAGVHELRQLQRLAYRRFYLRGGYLLRRVAEAARSPSQLRRYLAGLRTMVRVGYG